jgi:hypothetical protein
MDNSISYQPTQLNLKPDFGSIFIVAGRQYKNSGDFVVDNRSERYNILLTVKSNVCIVNFFGV